VGTVDVDPERRGQPGTVGGVRDAVVDSDRVGRLGERELDVPARPGQVTAWRPEASAARTPTVRLEARTVPFVAASSASYSVNGTLAPRPGMDSAETADAGVIVVDAGGGDHAASTAAPASAVTTMPANLTGLDARLRIDSLPFIRVVFGWMVAGGRA